MTKFRWNAVRSGPAVSPLSRRRRGHRMFGRSASALAACVLIVASGLSDIAADAEALVDPAPWPRTRAIVNNPYGDVYAKDAILNELTNLLNYADAGSIARIAIYEHKHRGLWEAMEAARRRGVKVRVVHGDYTKEHWDGPYMANFPERTALNADASWEVSCTPKDTATSACVGGTGAIMHNKFATFTSVKGVKNITVISSQNWTGANYWQNAVVVTGNSGLHDKFGKFFSDMALKRRNPNYYDSTSGAPASFDADGTSAESFYGKYRTYFFPKASGSANPILSMLGTVDCTVRDLPTGVGHQGRSLVRVAMNVWTDTRTDIATKLKTMDEQGCVVQVIYHLRPDNTNVAGIFRGSTVQRWWKKSSNCANPPAEAPISVHSKYVAVSGRVSGVNNKVVYTGSVNYTHPALYRNDESMLRVDDDVMHDVFYGNFSAIANAGIGTSSAWQRGPEASC